MNARRASFIAPLALVWMASVAGGAVDPKITGIARNGQGITLSWTCDPTHLSAVEYSTDLINWNRVRVVRALAASHTENFDSSGDTRGFYRVKTGPPPAQPNVVIFVTDDGGWADVGYHTYGTNVPIQTPNMDRFLAEGIRLERFYPTAVCSVTRACLLTGRNTIRTSVNNTHGLDLHEHTMPETFRAAGYQTLMCGKWHLGGPYNNTSIASINGESIGVPQENEAYLPFNRFWDHHYGEYTGAIDYFTHASNENGAPDWWHNGQPLVETVDLQGHGGYSTDLLADHAVQLLQDRDPFKPVLLYVAFNGIHGPVQAPASVLAKYGNKSSPSYIANAQRRLIAAAMDAEDTALGRVLSAIDAEGLRGNTLVVWFSDNGGDTTKGSINLPLRGTKGDSYEGGIHTPAAIRWPEVLPANVTSDQFVWVGDLFPTICTAVGVIPRNTKPLDGISLWRALQSAGTTGSSYRGAPLVTATAAPVAYDDFTDPISSAKKTFKLIRTRIGQNYTYELFNIIDDPSETNELSANRTDPRFSAIVSSLEAAINNVADHVEVYPPFFGGAPSDTTAAPGNTVTLHASFTSYPKKTPNVIWRRNGLSLQSGGRITIAAPVAAMSEAGVINLTGVALSGTTSTPSAEVRCDDTSRLVVGMTLSGASVPTKASVKSITDATHFVMSATSTATSAGLSWTAVDSIAGVWVTTCTISGATASDAGVYDVIADNSTSADIDLAGCSTIAGDATIRCVNTAGLSAGMNVSGEVIPPNATVQSVTDGTHFVMSAKADSTSEQVDLVAGSGGVALSRGATLQVP